MWVGIKKMTAGSEGSWIPSANMPMNLSERGEGGGGEEEFRLILGNGGCVPPQVRAWPEPVEGWKGFN